ncbi:MAG: YdcF family protein [Alphaproteobacteria bacterium]|nr:YdcF family protein [Alphaproteobacteria bacterium]
MTLTAWAGCALALDRYGQRTPPPGPWDAIVVAGCRVRPDGTASLALRRRVELGVALWQQGLAPRIVMTGGLGDHAPTEAQAAADVARELGVPRRAILLEDRSTSTEENARNAATIAGPRVLVVTDAYHVARAERVFGRYFDEAVGVGSVGPLDARTRGALREVAAIGWYGVRGRL